VAQLRVPPQAVERPQFRQQRLRARAPSPQESLLQPATESRREVMRLLVAGPFVRREMRQELHPSEQSMEQIRGELPLPLVQRQAQRARVLVDFCLKLEFEQRKWLTPSRAVQ